MDLQLCFSPLCLPLDVIPASHFSCVIFLVAWIFIFDFELRVYFLDPLLIFLACAISYGNYSSRRIVKASKNCRIFKVSKISEKPIVYWSIFDALNSLQFFDALGINKVILSFVFDSLIFKDWSFTFVVVLSFGSLRFCSNVWFWSHSIRFYSNRNFLDLIFLDVIPVRNCRSNFRFLNGGRNNI